MSTQELRIAFAGGGTGGHVFPIVNLIEQIQLTPTNKAVSIFRLGKKSSLEYKQAKLLPHVAFVAITAGKFRRQKTLKAITQNVVDASKILIGVLQSLRCIQKNSINVVFSKGGYVALPVVLAARLLRVPILVHESDTSMGQTNRIAARRADRVYTAFDAVYPGAIRVGQLLHTSIAEEHEESSFEKIIEHTYDPKTVYVLVMGGSQGAQSLYEAISSAIMETKEQKDEGEGDILNINGTTNSASVTYHYIVIAGLLNTGCELFRDIKNVTQLAFLNQTEMATVYQFCDIAITRAGTTSLAEQKIRDMKLLMVPLPRTHDQKTNAEYYVHNHADIMIEQDRNLSNKLKVHLMKLGDYHKELQKKDRKHRVAYPKQQIVNHLFTSY